MKYNTSEEVGMLLSFLIILIFLYNLQKLKPINPDAPNTDALDPPRQVGSGLI